MTGPVRRYWPLVAALVAAIAITAATFSFVRLKTDLGDFVPSGGTSAMRFVLRELSQGAVGNVLLVGITGLPGPELATASTEVAERLGAGGAFTVVENGRRQFGTEEQAFLFAHRFQLSPAVSPEAFSEAGLRASLQRFLAALQSSASPLVQRFGFADPIGSFIPVATAWAGSASVRTVDGVWFSQDETRALLVARTVASSADIEGQARAVAAVRDAVAQATDGKGRVLLGGAPAYAIETAAMIRLDVERLSLLSVVLIAGFLYWRFRSLWINAAIAVVLMLGISAGALAVGLVFGSIHGIALGFGITTLGLAVDYPVLLVGHRKRSEAAPATLARIGRAFVVAVITAVLGLAGMLLTGFPGLRQLGLFSVVGLLAAAAATYWLLPRLIVAADLAPTRVPDERVVTAVEGWRGYRGWLALPIALALVVLALRPPHLEGDLTRLSPAPDAVRQSDDIVRGDLGASDPGQLIVVSGTTADEVLQRQERLAGDLAVLQTSGAIGGADSAANLLPSIATQRARQAAIPDAATLAGRLRQASAGLPFKPDALQPFLAASAAARTAAPLTLDGVRSPLLATRLAPLLYERDGRWFGPVVLRDVQAPAQVAAAAAMTPGALYVDVGAETNAAVAAYTRDAWVWFAAGAGAALLVLLAGLRDVGLVTRVVAAILVAELMTLAVLCGAGVGLTLFHIVSLQLVAGVGLDYAVFFARRRIDLEERGRTLHTLMICNAMTLVTFGLLALCRTTLLRDIGLTVALGAFLALVSAFFIVGDRTAATAEARS